MAVQSTRRVNLGTQAQRDAAIQFAPKKTALSEALQNAREEYGSSVQAGKSTAKLTQQAAQQALPQISQIYSKADSAQQAGATLLSSDLAGLPGVANSQKAGASTEVQQQLANLIGARARDSAQLTNAGTAAAAGAQFNQLSAQQTLHKAVAGILGKAQTTAQEQGAAAATETEKLAHEAEKMEQSERQSERTAGTSRTNAKEGNAQQERASQRTAASKTGKAAKPPLAVKDATSKVSSIKQAAAAILSEGHDRTTAIADLQEAVPAISKKTGKNTSIHIPERKAYTPDVLMSAALDEAEYGHVLPGTVQRLKSAHYDPTALGLNTRQPSVQHPAAAQQQSRERGAGRRGR